MLADEAIPNCPNLTHCFVTGRLENATKVCKNKIDLNFDEAIENASDLFKPVYVNSENPLYLLYTSGSTGKPKGLIHTTGGYITHAKLAHQHAFNGKKTHQKIKLKYRIKK